MNLIFSEPAWNDYLYWQQNDKKIVQRINLLIKNIQSEPFTGLGNPEALRFNFSGYWSRRITIEHRLVYKINENKELYIAACRYHYRKDS